MKITIISASIAVMLLAGNATAAPDCTRILREYTRHTHMFINQESVVTKLSTQLGLMEAEDDRSDDWYDDYIDLSLELHNQARTLTHLRDMKYFWRVKATSYCGVGRDYDRSKRVKKV